MRRTDRLFDLLQILRDGKLHTAQEMAETLGVSVRTIYRDMETLQMSGVPVEGERGVGYMATGALTLPPLSLTAAELEALNLGIAIVAEAGDPDLAADGAPVRCRPGQGGPGGQPEYREDHGLQPTDRTATANRQLSRCHRRTSLRATRSGTNTSRPSTRPGNHTDSFVSVTNCF